MLSLTLRYVVSNLYDLHSCVEISYLMFLRDFLAYSHVGLRGPLFDVISCFVVVVVFLHVVYYIDFGFLVLKSC